MGKLGWAAYHQKKFDKALHAFDWLRTYHPETPYAAPLAGMGWALFSKGQLGPAQNLFIRSLTLFPRNLTAMLGMTALKKAPETDEEDMDDEPEPPPPPKKKAKKSQAAVAEKPTSAKKAQKKTEPAEQGAPGKKTKKSAQQAEEPAPAQKKGKKSEKKTTDG